ncbi:MAG: hypothetical protein IJ946_09230 [Clostridia bacterium]|nr:hypothetical protein [Clostridia bacterium]
MNIKRILCLVLAVVMVASLAACTGSAVSVKVNDEGEFAYSVVRAFGKEFQEVEDAAKQIRISMKENFGCKVKIAFDTAYDDFEGNYEILVGDTKRVESQEAKDKLINNRLNNASDFIVAVIGDKICIQAVNPKMVKVAADWFVLNYCGSIDDFKQLYKGYEFIYAPEGNSVDSTIAGENISKFTFVLPRKTSMLHGLAVDEILEFYDKNAYATFDAEDMDAEAEYEVLVGDCDRPASKGVIVEGDNYVIKVIGKKLVIKGGSDLATWRAVKAFYDELLKSKETKTPFNWADGHTINGKYDANEEGVYTLNWSDEFDSSTIDLNKWSDYRTGKDTVNTSALGGNFYQVNVRGESKYEGSEKKNLIHQADGYMVCGTKRVNDKDFITSQISTYWTMTFKYGVMDIYSKLAPDPAYTTYWANGAATSDKNWQKRFGGQAQDRYCMTEIDILENYSRPHEYGSTIHWWWSAYNADGTKNTGTNGHTGLGGNALYKKGGENSAYLIYDQAKYGDLLPDDFHMYSFYWDDECFKFAFDGKIFMRYYFKNHDSVSVHCLMNYLISSCAMGSANYGYTYSKDKHEDYYEHKIDYIRLYQTDAINSQLVTAWPETQANGTPTIRYPENTLGNQY